MAGIYIHIPYCRQKCNYCNFFSIVSGKTVPEMIAAICHEMELRKTEIGKNTIETIYLGGGTPSLLAPEHLSKIFDTIRSLFVIDNHSEITLEANPDDITIENLRLWKGTGINRLSIGIQSFSDEDLVYLNRIHTARKAIDCINLAREYGFPDLTIDLIYGIPTLTNEGWNRNLQIFSDLNLPHLSAYALTVEPRTPLYHLIQKGELKAVDEQQSADQFEMLMSFAAEHGYLHYEISNFCLPGHFARHNLSYWRGIEYYGFGPSAHSFNSNSRKWNVSSATEYIKALQKGILPFESENLGLTEQYNEYVMTGLRTIWGCNADEILNKFGQDYHNHFLTGIENWVNRSMAIHSNGSYILTDKGKLQADGIASDLFII